MSAKKVPMRNLRTLVPPETFASLELEAIASGVTLAAHVRNVLIDHTLHESERMNLPKPPTAEEWAHFTTWMNVHGLTPERIKEATGIKSRRSAIEWAKTKGYMPEVKA